MTAVISWVAKYVGTLGLDSTVAMHNLCSSTISWTAGVVFGYFANFFCAVVVTVTNYVLSKIFVFWKEER